MQKNNRDPARIIFTIAILVFIVFFISRWFAGSSGESAATASDTAPVVSVYGEETEQVSTQSAPEPDEEAVTDGKPDSDEDPVSDEEPNLVEDEVLAEEPVRYEFRNRSLLDKHYEKHGIEMGFASAEEYEAAASAVVTNPDSLHKLEEEDGDDVFYLEETREFVIVSTDGFIRTYYYANRDYYDRQ